MTGATLRSRLETAYSTRQALLNAFTAVLDANADAALADLAIIASDNWLSRVEKPAVVQQWTAIFIEYPPLEAQAAALGVTTARTNYTNARDALAVYLGTLSPAWDNTATDSPIVGSTFRAKFTDYYTAKTALQNAMFAASGGGDTGALSVSVDSDVVGALGAPGASATTLSVTATVQGATSAVTYSWARVGGNSNAVATSAASATTSFTATIEAGQTVVATFKLTVRETATGRVGSTLVGAEFTDNTI